MFFLMAQPAINRFKWELEVCLQNLKSLGVNDIILLFSKYDDSIPNYLEKKYGVKTFIFPDQRKNRFYIPSIKPYLWYQFLKYHPEYEKEDFFYMDADVIFRELPDFKILDKNMWYGSNCNSYLSAEYIESRGSQLLQTMSRIVGIDPIQIENMPYALGAQWIIRKPIKEYWKKVYDDSNKLYHHMLQETPKYTRQGYKAIQNWTAEMWAQLWNLLYFHIPHKYSPELDFCWATDDISKWGQTKIYHNAGVVRTMIDLFFKGQYVNKSPLKEDLSFVNKHKCSYMYVQAIKKVKN